MHDRKLSETWYYNTKTAQSQWTRPPELENTLPDISKHKALKVPEVVASFGEIPQTTVKTKVSLAPQDLDATQGKMDLIFTHENIDTLPGEHQRSSEPYMGQV